MRKLTPSKVEIELDDNRRVVNMDDDWKSMSRSALHEAVIADRNSYLSEHFAPIRERSLPPIRFLTVEEETEQEVLAAVYDVMNE